MAIAPMSAQSKKQINQAKADAKLEAKALKQEGFQNLGSENMEDKLYTHLLSADSNSSSYEVIGKAEGQSDLTEAKTLARTNAVANYSASDVSDVFFVWRKNKKAYDVYCYATLTGESAKMAASNKPKVFTESEKAAAVKAADQAKKDAKDAVKKADAQKKKVAKQAEKADQKAQKEVKAAQEKADKKAQKAVDKAEKAKAKAEQKAADAKAAAQKNAEDAKAAAQKNAAETKAAAQKAAQDASTAAETAAKEAQQKAEQAEKLKNK